MKQIRNHRRILSTLTIAILATIPMRHADTCTRIIYETGNNTFITGRTMDWMDPKAQTALWLPASRSVLGRFAPGTDRATRRCR